MHAGDHIKRNPRRWRRGKSRKTSLGKERKKGRLSLRRKREKFVLHLAHSKKKKGCLSPRARTKNRGSPTEPEKEVQHH